MSLMATGGGNGETSSFFKLGEIRLAKDSDFQHFRELADSNDGWTQKLDKNGLVVWSKETQSSSIKMMKIRGEFQDVSAGTAFDTLLDGEYRRTWDENVIEDYELCALDGNNDVGYYSFKCPGPITNRDFVNQRSWRWFGDEYIIFNHSIPHQKLPPKKDFIRGVSYITGFVIRAKGTGCALTYVTQSDPRGKIPKWVINFAINKAAPSIFRKMNVAASKYEEWKLNNRPEYKPWRFPDQNPLPVVDVQILQEESKTAILLPSEEKRENGKEGKEEEEEGDEDPPSELLDDANNQAGNTD